MSEPSAAHAASPDPARASFELKESENHGQGVVDLSHLMQGESADGVAKAAWVNNVM